LRVAHREFVPGYRCAQRVASVGPGRGYGVGAGQTRGSREIGKRARSWLVVRPQRLSSTDDGPERDRAEVTGIEGGWLVPIHEKHFVSCNCSTALPDRQWAALPIALERHSHPDSVDTDNELVSAY